MLVSTLSHPSQPTAPNKRQETPEDGGALALGNYDDKRKQLQAERHQEYNKLLAQVDFSLYVLC